MTAFFAGAATARPVTPVFAIPGHVDGAQPAAALVLVDGAYYGTTAAGGAANLGVVFRIDAATGEETILHHFSGASGDGAGPSSSLTPFEGKLYGTTREGGAHGAGTVFSLDVSTGKLAIITSFPGLPGDFGPRGGLTVEDGLFYGTTPTSGRMEDGTIFTVDPATGTETTVYTFGETTTDGAAPQGLIAGGGTLYGVTQAGGAQAAGTIFAFDPATAKETQLHAFSGGDGALPQGKLLAADGALYGTTSFGGAHGLGTVFGFNPDRRTITTLHDFAGKADSGMPLAGLVQGGNSLFGTSAGFNGAGNGAVFEVEPASGHFTTLFTFPGGYDGANPATPLIVSGGQLCGTAENAGYAGAGVAFCVDPEAGTETRLHQFAYTEFAAVSGLARLGHALYGAAAGGGDRGFGAIFAINPDTGAGRIVYNFSGGPDGTFPAGTLAALGGKLYGTTPAGGASDNGTFFVFDPATNRKTILHDFAGSDGVTPEAGPTVLGGQLYGPAASGGAAGAGAIYRFDPATAQFAVLTSLAGGGDGKNPWAPLAIFGGRLVGTTLNGGTKDNGVVFTIDPATGAYGVLYRFKGGKDGGSPFAPVTELAGKLYGTTSGFGSTIGNGTLFRIDPATGTETPLYQFDGAGGSMPLSGLTAHGTLLFGVTSEGGKADFGVLYDFNTGTESAKALYDFRGGADGGLPQSMLLPAAGFLYGTSLSINGETAGVVFRW